MKRVIIIATAIILIHAPFGIADEFSLDLKITLDVTQETGAKAYWLGVSPYSPQEVKEEAEDLRKQMESEDSTMVRRDLESRMEEMTQRLPKREPEYHTDAPLYYSVWFGSVGDRQIFLCVLDESDGTGTGYDRLYIDINGNKDMTDDSVFSGVEIYHELSGRGCRFGPIKIMLGSAKDRTPYYCQMKTCGNDLLISSACYRSGEVNLEQTRYRIALVDSTSDGEFNNSGQSEYHSDMIAVDANSDDGFDKHLWYTRYISLGGQWYSFEASRDGSTLRITQPQVAQGVLRTPCNGFIMQLRAEEGLLRLESDDYEAKLPAGVYHFSRASYRLKHSDGTVWELTEVAQQDSAGVIVIELGKTTDFAFGSPLSMKLSMDEVIDGKAKFVLKLIGQAKGECSIAPIGKSCPPPSLRISSMDGQFSETYMMGYG